MNIDYGKIFQNEAEVARAQKKAEEDRLERLNSAIKTFAPLIAEVCKGFANVTGWGYTKIADDDFLITGLDYESFDPKRIKIKILSEMVEVSCDKGNGYQLKKLVIEIFLNGFSQEKLADTIKQCFKALDQ